MLMRNINSRMVIMFVLKYVHVKIFSWVATIHPQKLTDMNI